MSVERKLAQRIKGSRPIEGLPGSAKKKHPGENSSHGFLMCCSWVSMLSCSESLWLSGACESDCHSGRVIKLCCAQEEWQMMRVILR